VFPDALGMAVVTAVDGVPGGIAFGVPMVAIIPLWIPRPSSPLGLNLADPVVRNDDDLSTCLPGPNLSGPLFFTDSLGDRSPDWYRVFGTTFFRLCSRDRMLAVVAPRARHSPASGAMTMIAIAQARGFP
jgi:hypothetical protein